MYDNLVATGFLRMAPDATWANITGYVPDRLEVIADEIDVLGSAVLGLTMKCARCHSHKFDPIPQRDYYRLVAVFKGAYDEYDWLKPDVRPGLGPVSQDVLGGRHLPYVTTAEQRSLGSDTTPDCRGDRQRERSTRTNAVQGDVPKLEAASPEPRNSGPVGPRRAVADVHLPPRRSLSPGRLVGPGVPSVLTDGKTPFDVKPPWPGAKKTGRRLAFARWLTQPDHPLTARVAVNRLWKHHFGTGIVKTLGNFGKAGTPPTHPELLDWLAREFVRRGWSLKAMHRLMMTSATYRQSSAVTPEQESSTRTTRFIPACRWSAWTPRRSTTRCCWSPAGWTRPVRPGGAVQVRGRRPGDARRDRPRLAAAHLRAAGAEAAADAPGELRFPADEPQLRRAARLHRRPAGAAPDEQRHGPTSWPSISPDA